MAQTREALNLQRFIIAVVIVGVVLVLGIYISDAIGNTTDTPNTASRANNESLGTVTTGNTFTVASATTKQDFAGMVVLQMLNGTGTSSQVIPTTNYSYTSVGVITPKFGPWNNSVWKVTYTYSFTNESAASTAANNVTDALSTGTAWISILVVVGFATIILTMLTSGLGGAARREEVPYY